VAGEGNIVELEITVFNLGSALANNVSVLAGFDTGAGKLWNGERSESFQIGINQKVTVKLYLRVPFNKHTQLVV